MCSRRSWGAEGLSLALLLALSACNGTSRQAWEQARDRRDPAAYGAWIALDPESDEGREARRRLEEAAPIYRAGVEEVRRGDPDARDTLARAVALAPIDPALYLPLARAFRAQAEAHPDNPHLFIRAAEYYRKYLTLAVDQPEREAARRELEELDPEGPWSLGALDEPAPSSMVEPAPVGPPLAVLLAALAIVLALAAIVAVLARSRGRTLEELADARPELHPAIAYLVSSLRHELLKHRIGAVASAVSALADGSASAPQREFLATRLYGGEPLLEAWEGHLLAFERGLGPELDVRVRDRVMRKSARAIRRIAALRPALSRGDARAGAELARAHADLSALDRRLAELVARLVRTRVDDELLRKVVAEVRGEHAAGSIALDGVAIEAPDPAPAVEVFRVDLVLVLKNVARNAVLAAGEGAPPRRVRIEVRTELEPTGEENVVVRVLDTGPGTLTTEAIYERRVDRGLGLVTAALRRYDGAIAVEPAEAPFTKAVAVRFFRAFEET